MDGEVGLFLEEMRLHWTLENQGRKRIVPGRRCGGYIYL